MLKIINFNQKNFLGKLQDILNKRKSKQKAKTAIVNKIIFNVKKKGDKAVLSYEKKFSRIKTKSKKISFSKKEITEISKKIDKKLKNSIDLAFNRIKTFHKKQKFLSFKLKDKFKNELSYKYSAIDRVGVYVPGRYRKLPKHCFNELHPCDYSRVKNIYLTTPTLDNN